MDFRKPLDKQWRKSNVRICTAGIVYRYYPGFPSQRDGFDSRYPLQSSCKFNVAKAGYHSQASALESLF
jgi:hypothetical protein